MKCSPYGDSSWSISPRREKWPERRYDFGSLDGLGVPVGMGLVDAPNGIRVREVLTVRGLNWSIRPALEKCPERRYDLAESRASRWPIVEAWAAELARYMRLNGA